MGYFYQKVAILHSPKTFLAPRGLRTDEKSNFLQDAVQEHLGTSEMKR